MSKITNKKEKYRSRSKNVIKSSSLIKERVNNHASRKEFSVDSNGYFIWASSFDSKKI